MIRLIEDVAAEIENRACPAAVTFMFGIRMDLWPVFQKVMSENIDGVKKLAEGGGSSYFSRAVALTESTVANVRCSLQRERNYVLTGLSSAITTSSFSTHS